MTDYSNYPTMTLNEMADVFRANPVEATETKLARMITEGVFPFAVGIEPRVSHEHRVLLISREGCYKWLGEFLQREVVRV